MLGDGLDDACRESLERWGVPGAVVGALAAGEADVRSYGVTALAGGETVRPETTFRIASITKPFTATLALLLVEDGLLALDEPVRTALPEGHITLRHLLSHLGGFEGEAGDLARFGDGDDALGGVVAELSGQRQVVPPGTVWSYCNAGYWAAGFVCAEARGTTYEDALRERVLAPLGLVSTGFGEPEARGHDQPDAGSPRHEATPAAAFPRARRPSGGLVSNALDLLGFAAFHLADERLARLREPEADTPDGAYGLGWARERVAGADVWHHEGGYGGFRTLLALVPEQQVAFTILTNGSGGEAVVREVSDALLAGLCGLRRERPPTVPLPPAELELLTGSYANPEVDVKIAPDGAGLVLDVVAISPVDASRTRLPRLDARPVGARRFAIVGGQWADERLDFVPEDGPARFVRLASRLAERC
jgi:CubicO group peptidase (beta-lactamase class C family)